MARAVLPIVSTPGQLPALCARCGAGGVILKSLTLSYTPTTPGQKVAPELGRAAAHFPGAILAGSVLGVGVLLHGLWTGRNMTLLLPLCVKHQRHVHWQARWLSLGIWLLGALAVGLTVPAVLASVRLFQHDPGDKWGGLLFLYFLPAFAAAVGALLFRAHRHEGFIYILRATDEEVELGGLAESFVQKLRPL